MKSISNTINKVIISASKSLKYKKPTHIPIAKNYSTFTKSSYNNKLSNNTINNKEIQNLFRVSKKNYHKDIDYTKDYYKVLGVSKSSTDKDIKLAYLKLVKQHHPDANGGKSTEKFKEITSAYDVLGDKSKRSAYDSGSSPFSSPFSSNSSSSNPFSSAFKQGNFNAQYQDPSNFSSHYRSNSNFDKNFYSNFNNIKNNFKDTSFYKEYTQTYTFTDKDGKRTTYTFKSGNPGDAFGGKADNSQYNNPFYQDLNDLSKKRRAEREQREQQAKQNGNKAGYQNDFFGNKYEYFYQRPNSQETHHQNQYKNNNSDNSFFNNSNFSYEDHIIQQEKIRLFKYVFLLTAFILVYSNYVRRRRLQYMELENDRYNRYVDNNRSYYEPVAPSTQYHSHYGNDRTYFTKDELPPFK